MTKASVCQVRLDLTTAAFKPSSPWSRAIWESAMRLTGNLTLVWTTLLYQLITGTFWPQLFVKGSGRSQTQLMLMSTEALWVTSGG